PEKPDHRHRRLLRARRERPRGRPAEQRDELAPPHSITSSAATCSVGGTARSSALAVPFWHGLWVPKGTPAGMRLPPTRLLKRRSGRDPAPLARGSKKTGRDVSTGCQ